MVLESSQKVKVKKSGITLKNHFAFFVSKIIYYDSSSSPLASNKIANYEITYVAIDFYSRYTCPFCNCLVQYCILLEVIKDKT